MFQDVLLGFLGKTVVLILLFSVPPLVLNLIKSVRQGSKASNIPYSTAEWVILFAVYAIGLTFFVLWVLA